MLITMVRLLKLVVEYKQLKYGIFNKISNQNIENIGKVAT